MKSITGNIVVDYLKGRFAWGHRLGGKLALEALPISMLKSVKTGK